MGKNAAGTMTDLDALAAELDTLLGEWEACGKQLTKAKTDNKPDEAKRLQELYNDLKGKVEQKEVDFQQAQEFAAKRETLRQVREMAKSESSTESGEQGAGMLGKVNIPAQGIPAEARDHGKEERDKEKFFLEWMDGKTLEGQKVELLQPKSKKWDKGVGGLAIPMRLAKSMMPSAFRLPKLPSFEEYMESLGDKAKALPATSVVANYLNVIPPDFRREQLQYPGEEGHLFSRVRKVPSTTGFVTWPKLTQAAPGSEGSGTEFAEYGGVSVAWTTEASVKPGTEPTFEQVTIAVHELSARTELSRTLLGRSAINLEEFMSTEFRAAIMHKLDFAFLNGNGSGKPYGVLSTSGIQNVNRSAANAVGYDDFVNLEHAVAPQFRANGMFLLADSALQYIKKLKDSYGRPLWMPAMANGAPATIFGYPYVSTQRLSLGSEGDIIFGDWSQYIAPVEQEVVMLKSEHRKIEQGVIVYVVFMLVGGKPVQTRAFSKLAVAHS